MGRRREGGGVVELSVLKDVVCDVLLVVSKSADEKGTGL